LNAAELARLLKAKRSGSGWIAKCPAHEDHRESLSIGESKSGRLLLKCHAGCEFGAILKAAGVEPIRTNGQDPSKPRVVATYDYHDAEGKLVYQVVRLAPKDFRQRRPDSNGGWIWNMTGVERLLRSTVR
jgi:putative DNA primase/helicase